ncbi:response regulator [Aliishimia ponticola]|nr:response regulator [Aliishimia ponticola]
MKKVMVVDDDPETRLIVSDLLSRLDIKHEVAASAGECLGRLVKDPNSYGLVLMDIHMPTLSGVDASTWISSSETDPPRSIPVVAFTGDKTYHCRNYVSQFGMKDFLAKPVTLDTLSDTVASYAAL